MISLPEFVTKLKEKVSNANRIMLFLHKSPDPDSVGSNLAIANLLKIFNSNSEIIVLSVDDLSLNLKEIIKNKSNLQITLQEPAEFTYQPNDFCLFLDFAEFQRVSRVKDAALPEFVDLAIIDHHVLPEINNVLNFIETSNISTASIVYKIYQEAGFEIDVQSYFFIILGLLGDSGFLRFKDANFVQSLDIIKEFCLKFGTDKYFEIIGELEKNMPIEEYILEGIYLNNMVYDEKNKFAYTTMTLKERENKNISKSYSEFINGATVIRNIGNSLFTCSITEDKKEANKFNLSFRSSSGSNFVVRDIAVNLGGGGHRSAAGAQISASSIEEAIERVRSAIHETIGI